MPEYITIDRILAIIAIGIAIYLYIKSRKEKAPICLYASITLEPKEFKLPGSETVKVLYGGKELERFTRTRLILWNKGREAIKNEDLREPIKLVFSGEILGSTIIKRTKESNKFKLSREETIKNKVLIEFDFLDQGDGATFDIFHTGNEEAEPIFEGTIIGVTKGIAVRELGPTLKTFLIQIFALMLAAALLGSGLTLSTLEKFEVCNVPDVYQYFLFGLCTLFLFINAYPYYHYGLLPWRPYPKHLHPD